MERVWGEPWGEHRRIEGDCSVALLILAVFVIVYLAFCAAVAQAAQNKGRSWWAYFFLSVLFSPLVMGIIVACISTDVYHMQRVAYEAQIKAGAQPLKKCPDCAEMVQPDARKCRHCGYEFVMSGVGN